MHTILFTDIEGSTRLWEEHPEDMASALARHDQIVADAIAQADGQVLKTTGDGFIAIFESASRAVGAALGIQEALTAEPWGSTGPIRVRVGVHAGETESRDGDYFGPAMNRAARIMAAGHGGQVLLSAAVAALAVDDLPSGATLHDLGSHRLKDLTRPEHLYQLEAANLTADFPELRTLTAKSNNLPLQATEFLGRSNELTAIKTMMGSANTRLLTLAGPGGAGKTRLALQVAAELSDWYRDGVFFVDLSAESEPDAAFEAVVRALDLPVSGSGAPLQTLKTRLRDRQMLLVLDNLEQVMAAATGVSELLQDAAELKIIVTSREMLRVRAEQVFPVPPLSLPTATASTGAIAESEAVQLFVERARTVRPDFALTDGNARNVAEICARLDGLPLAIELAAARLNLFTPADLLLRLEERLDVLGAGGRDLPERQRTLWGAIGWSYELLDETERELFEAMSVFTSAGLTALEAVVASSLGSMFVLDPLSSLVDKSLVQSHEDGATRRFSMLRMIKEFASEQLARSPDRELAVREAHARHFSDFALKLDDRLRRSERDSALQDLESEIGNLRTAWRFWVDRGDLDQLFNLIDGLWALHEAKGWYHAAIELTRDMLGVLATSEPSAEQAAEELTLRISLARALMAVGGYNVEVEEAFTRALELSDASGTAEQKVPVLRALASYYLQTTDSDAAASVGRQLLDLGEQGDDRLILAEGHYVLGASTLFTDAEASLAHLDRAIELFDPNAPGSNRFRLGPNSGIVARTASGLMLWQCGELERSVSRINEALELARTIDHPFSIAYALYHSGFLAINRGRFAECLECAHELAEISDANDYPLWATLARLLEGVAISGQGRGDEGLVMTEAAIDLYQGLTPPPVFWPFILMLRGVVHAMAGHPERAFELLDEAIAAVRVPGAATPDLTVAKADILRMLPGADLDIAEALYLEAIEAASGAGFHLAVLTASTRLVTLRREMGRTPDGSEELAAVYATFTEGHDEHDLVVAREVLGGALV
jgi:predicted ATPase/class 3 adenylate cyclase